MRPKQCLLSLICITFTCSAVFAQAPYIVIEITDPPRVKGTTTARSVTPVRGGLPDRSTLTARKSSTLRGKSTTTTTTSTTTPTTTTTTTSTTPWPITESLPSTDSPPDASTYYSPYSVVDAPGSENDPGESSADVVSLDDLSQDDHSAQSKWVQQIAYIVKSPAPGDMTAEKKAGARSLGIEGSKVEEEQSKGLRSGDDAGEFENLSWISQVLTKSMWRFYPRSKKNSACTFQGDLYRKHFKNMTQWAVKMFDSSDVTPGGVLETDYFNAGHFDECLAIDVKQYNLLGQYCLVGATYSPFKDLSPEFYAADKKINYNQPNPMKSVWLDAKPHFDPARKNRSAFEFAVCLPKSCTAKDLETSLQETINPVAASHRLNVKVSVHSLNCSIRDPGIKDPVGFTLTLLVIFGAGSLVVVGTFLDVLVYRKAKSKSFWRTYLKPFSAAKNLVKLKKPSNDSEFAPINAVKFLVLIQIIVGHRVMFMFGNRVFNPSYIERLVRHPLCSYINGGSSVVVDVFFVFSGFLAYLFIHRTLEQKKRINLIMITFYRWLRIVPLYALVIAAYTFVMPNVADGPRWNTMMERETRGCRKNWWLNLLLINNYFNTRDQCMIHSWYLAVDMQLFILASLLAIIIYRHQRHAWTIFGVLITLSCIVPVIHIYISKYPAVTMTFQSFTMDVNADPIFHKFYIATHNRAIPYIIGLAAAHLYLKLKEINFKFTTLQMWTLAGIIAILGNVSVLYTALFYQADRPYNVLEHMIFNPLQRIMFATIPMGILIGQGTTGFGIISRFMASPLFTVLGRLTYCGFLIHPLIQYTLLYSNRTSTYISPLQITATVGGDVFLTFLFAIAMNLMFESPFDRLQKKLLKSFVREYTAPKKPLEQPASTEVTEMTENGRSYLNGDRH